MPGIEFYDTTLRDGAQSEGISFSVDDKREMTRRLDVFGMDYIEAGWPGSNPVDDALFADLDSLKLKRSRISAFGSTCRRGIPPEEDGNLRALVECGAGTCCIFGKSSRLQAESALQVDPEENLSMIRRSVRFLKDAGKEVLFDAEHFFDGYREDREYAMSCLESAAEGGADRLVLCDTNGGSLPNAVGTAVGDVLLAFGVPIGIHCHNDCGLATACSMAAVDAGATMVQGTVNGIGERCGNADLCTVIPNLKLKAGYDIGLDLSGLGALSAGIAEIENVVRPTGLPYVGEGAFAHKGGMHVSAIARDPRTYEHVPPEAVGNARRILVSDMAGQASVSLKLRELGLTEENDAREIVGRIKEMEAAGYEFEGADASFELLVKKMRGEISPPFSLESFRVYIDSVNGGEMTSEASVKVSDGTCAEHTAADGNGPVDALDKALRKALGKLYPKLCGITLTDYKVRVLDRRAAASTVRVLVTSTDGRRSWTTVGVSQNVIEASLYALLDSIEYAILKEKEGDRNGRQNNHHAGRQGPYGNHRPGVQLLRRERHQHSGHKADRHGRVHHHDDARGHQGLQQTVPGALLGPRRHRREGELHCQGAARRRLQHDAQDLRPWWTSTR